MLISRLTNFFATVPDGCSHTFLAFKPWFQYLPSTDFGQKDSSGNLISGTQCDIVHFSLLGSSSDIILVLVAIVDDLLALAGLVALAFVIVGGIGFMTSEGNPDKAAQARNTVINALVGLVIAITATIFVSFLGNRLGS